MTDLVVGGAVGVTIGQYGQATATVPLPPEVIKWSNSPVGPMPKSQLDDWRNSTAPGSSILIALDEDSNPIWGGLIISRTTSEKPTADLAMVTLEGYFDRRYCGTANFTDIGQNTQVASLIDSFIADGVLPGLPIRVQALDGAGTVRTNSLLDSDDKTIYSVLQDMMSVSGGVEWTIGFERQASPNRITPVLFLGARVGSPAPAGLGPAVTFSLPGNVATASLVEDYSSGKGADRVTATSGQGPGRLQSPPQLSGDFENRLTFDYRWSPSTSITVVSTLVAHAQRALGILQNGSKAVALTVRRTEKTPKLNSEWFIGDDIGYDLYAPAWIDGTLANQVGRAIGWQRDDNVYTLVLAVQDVSVA